MKRRFKKCVHCKDKLPQPLLTSKADVVVCPSCWAYTPTGQEDRLREELEAESLQPYPKSVASRAICYASLIYQLATHNKRIDFGRIEGMISQEHGVHTAADHVRLVYLAERNFGALTDARPGVAIITASGGAAANRWTYIHVVFRGSRGTKAKYFWRPNRSANPYSAGWDKSAGQNLDWRANLNNRQTHCPWVGGNVRVHQGFLDVYRSMQEDLKVQLLAQIVKYPQAPVIVTGHSLGAAIAVLCSHDLEVSGICSPVCMAFCPPRAGNLRFVEDFNRRLAHETIHFPSDNNVFRRSFSFIQSNDPVSKGQKHSFRHAVNDRSSVAESLTIRVGTLTKIKLQDWSEIYYQVQNWTPSGKGMHKYTKMMDTILGVDVANQEGLFTNVGGFIGRV